MNFLKKILGKNKCCEIKKDVEVLDGSKISFEDFLKVEIKIGKIIKAEKIEKSEKLLKLSVDFGEKTPRQIISGISKFYTLEEIINKEASFVTNLAPRKIMGFESNGMILGISKNDEFSILSPEKKGDWVGVSAG